MVGLGLGFGVGVGVGNGNGNGDDTDTRVDSAPFPPPRRPCPRTHTEAGSHNAQAVAVARTNPLQLHGRAMNTDRRGDLTVRCRGHNRRGSWAVVGPGGRGRLRVRRQRGW
jgi:hypothetical protein